MCGVYQEWCAFRRSSQKREEVCRTCELVSCIACGDMLPQRCCAPQDIDSHFSHHRQVLCQECKKRGCSARRPGTYPCHGPCAKLLGCAAYAPDDLSKKRKDKAHAMVCVGCKAQAATREQQLRQLMKKSKRAACTCKCPLAHAEKCPMHIRRWGERAYPGCDVMSREDSEWLQQQKKRRRT